MKLLVHDMPRLLPGAVPPGELVISMPKDRRPLYIGRHFYNDFILPDKTVSRFHVEIKFNEDGSLTLRNLSSSNTTRLNARYLDYLEKAHFNPGDKLQLGEVVLALPAVPAPVADPLAEKIKSQKNLSPLYLGEIVTITGFPRSLLEAFEQEASTASAKTAFVPAGTAGAKEYLPAPTPGKTLRGASTQSYPTHHIPAASPNPAGANAFENEPLTGTGWGILLPDPVWLPWVCLGALTLAEIITNLTSYQIGLLLHSALLLWLLWYGALRQRRAGGRLALALCAAPLIRLLSLSLPLADFPQLFWYPFVAAPLLVAVWLVVRQLRLPAKALGLGPGNPLLQLMLAGGGFGLGAVEYIILRPAPLLNSVSVANVALAALVLIFFTGFNEEIIFRGLLQATALPQLKRWALVYVSLVFAVLHIGYKSVLDVVFVFAVGFTFAYAVMWGRSIWGVTLAHGLTNLMLFVILPNLNSPSAPFAGLEGVIYWLVWLGSGSALFALALLGWKAFRRSEFLFRAPEFSEKSPLSNTVAGENLLEDNRRIIPY